MIGRDLVKPYDWLLDEPAPRMLIEAMKLYGVAEIIGEKHNQTILNWAEECGLGDVYIADEIPWCGLFVAVVAKRAGKTTIPSTPLWARSWATFGEHCEPELGAVLVFSRGSGGHVGLYVGEDDDCYHVLGGNQGNRVCVSRLSKDRLLDCRVEYKIGKPQNCRQIKLAASGEVSTNEA